MDDQATAAHYSEAVERPCERFGREYALKNAIARLSQTNLPTLYDDLKMKLRALDSLGRKSRKIRGDLNAFPDNCIDPTKTRSSTEEFRPTCSTEKVENAFHNLPRLFYAVLQTSTVRFPALYQSCYQEKGTAQDVLIATQSSRPVFSKTLTK
ncbi:hypothetical protein CDAR_585321 [Caerostris darwini]|uniref:Uncharacterized protein n=1 Tax=Caerostris darwini TaxID=1538125 RepID=A0AAV4X3W0_9ARAC|nr:hypothetical protein CDAR_585321 [Caerostris darwini]